MQSNTIVDIELLEDTTLATTNAAMVAEEVPLGANKQQATAWIEQVLRSIKPENVTTEFNSRINRYWIKSANRYNTIKYTWNAENPATGNARIVIKFFAKWDQQQQLHPTYNGPRTGNYLKRLKSNYQALLKTIEFYQQDYQLVNVEGLKFELARLYQQQRQLLQAKCKIDETIIVRAARSDKNAIDDFHTNHDNSLELIQKFNESAIFKIKQAHCQAISKKSILKKVKEMEITSVKTDEENPLHTDLIHIFPIIHNHKTMDGRKEQKVYWYLSTTIPLGTIYPTSDRALGEAGVTNFRLHLHCRINGDIKLDDFSNTFLTPLTQVIRHSAFPAIYEQDLDRKKDSHLEMIKRVNRKLAESHVLNTLEDGAVAKLKIMTLMLMTPYAAENLGIGSKKLVTPLLKQFPNLEARGTIDADHGLQIRRNESEVSQVKTSYQAISENPPLAVNLKDASDNPISITVQRETTNPVFQLPVNLETTEVIKHVTQLIDPSVFLHGMVRSINHEGYFKLEQLFLQQLQAKINNIDPNKKKLSRLDKLLVEYNQQLRDYATEFELIYQQQDHKDYKKLTKTRQKIYQKFDPAFAELHSGLIKHLDRITNLEDRKFAGILIEFINVQKLFANLLYDKNYSGQLAYDMMSRLAVIANWLDYYVEIFCKSSKDRSGMLTLLIESFEIFYDMLGHYPQLDNGNDISWLQNILNSSVVFYSTSKVVASLNSPGSEGLNQSHVPFLQEHARDYLHSIGKLSKQTWEIKFDKSDPYADKREAVSKTPFLQKTHEAIEKFIDHIKVENGFAKAIDRANTKLEALINYKGKSGQKLDEIKYQLPRLKQKLIEAINEFHAKTKNDNQAFEKTFEDLKNRLMRARYYSSNKAVFAGSDSKRACQPEFITQLKQLLAQVNEFRANNQSHGQDSKTIQLLDCNLALMVNILTHHKDVIRKKIEVLNYRESGAVMEWRANLAEHQNKSASLTVPSSEDNGSSAEDAYQSDQEPADTQPLLSESSEEADFSQQVVTEHRTSQEYKNSIEEYIREAVTSFDTARKRYIIDMERIDELLKGVDHLRQILIADWELRKFQQETYLLKVAITRFIERLLTTEELVDDGQAKNWRDNVDKWAADTFILIDYNQEEALTGSRDLFTAKQELQDFSAYLLILKEAALNNNYIKKSYPSCTEPFLVNKIKMQIKKSAEFLLPETTLKLEQALKNFADIRLIVQQKLQQAQPLSEQEKLQFDRAKATLEQLMTPLLQGQLPLEQRLFNLKQQVNKLLEQTATLGIEEEEKQTLTNPLIFKQVTDTEKHNKASASKAVACFRAGLFQGHRQDSIVKDLLEQALPTSTKLGTALGRGDCFFDAMAQSLVSIGKGSYTAKDLRKVCHRYVITLDKGSKEGNWIYQRFLSDAKRLHPNDEAKATLAAARSYQNYMANIGFTAAEIEAGQGLNCNTAIWGEQDIDGRILQEQLGFKLHVIELLESEEGLLVAHQLEGKSVIEINYEAQDTTHLVVFNNHFVPLLPSILNEDLISVIGETELEVDGSDFKHLKKIDEATAQKDSSKNEGIHEEQTATLGGEEEENVKTLIKKLGELKLELICFRPGDSLTTNTELEFIRLEKQITLLTNKLQSFEQENVQQLTTAVEQARQQVIEINQYRQTLNRKVEVLARLADGSYKEDQITAGLKNIPAMEEQRQLHYLYKTPVLR